jgi:pyruvate/2-oxoglutarate dehydrogenase complex dihydrolipoamide dehydrogenase (E3) component
MFGDHFSFKWPFKDFRQWQIGELERTGVRVILNTAPTPEELEAQKFDVVIAALGSRAKLPPIDGMRRPDGSPALKTCRDVIGRHEELGKNVIMVGCSETGIETACYLAENGHNVTCLTRQNQLAKDASPLHSITISWIKVDPETGYGHMAPYWEHFPNITGITEATTTSVTAHSVTYTDKDGASHTILGDSVIACGGVEANTAETLQYASAAPEFYMVGDGSGTPDLQTALRSAHAAALQI